MKNDAPVVVQAAVQPVVVVPVAPVVQAEPMSFEPQVPIKKYYGRRREDLSSDDDMNVAQDDQSMDTSQQR